MKLNPYKKESEAEPEQQRLVPVLVRIRGRHGQGRVLFRFALASCSHGDRVHLKAEQPFQQAGSPLHGIPSSQVLARRQAPNIIQSNAFRWWESGARPCHCQRRQRGPEPLLVAAEDEASRPAAGD
jgi:hypothetical protein